MTIEAECSAVLAGERTYAFQHGCSLEFMRSLPDDCVDLIFGSPPYENARWYGELNFKMKAQDWVDWMIPFFAEGRRVCRGLMALVVGHGRTEDWRWSGAPTLLEADLIRAGFRLRNPPVYARRGICGSGQEDWIRADHERVICLACNDEGPFPWSNNVAHGHPPKWAPGGEMSAFNQKCERRNQWGGSENGIGTRRPGGQIQGKSRPSHRRARKARAEDGEIKAQGYQAPALANPGNLIHAGEVEEVGDVVYGNVGGGHMGNKLAGLNEASMPMWLAEFFILSWCPPRGVVLDPFVGSGTTVHVAVENRRRAIGVDLRESQVALAQRRLEGVTPKLFIESDDRKAEETAARQAQGPEGDDHCEAGQVDRRRAGLFGA